MGILVGRVSGAIATTLAAALLGIGAADALFSAFFGAYKIAYNSCHNRQQYDNNNDVFHNEHPD